MIKKTALYILALPLLFAACKSKCIEDSGIHSSRESVVKPFDEIKLEGPIKLILRQDSSFKVEVGADSNIINLVKADVSGHELRLKLDGSKYCGKDSVIITAGIGDLKKLNVNGAGKVYTSSLINVNDLEMKISGAAKLTLDMNAGKLTTNSEGTASINLTGQAGIHQLKSEGVVELTAFGFVTGVYDLNLTGVAKLKINVLNDLKVKSSGSAEIYYKGNPKNVDQKKSGTAKLEKVI